MLILGFTIVVTNVPSLSVDKVVEGDNMLENNRKRMVWPEQISVVLIKCISCKLSKPLQLVLDPFVRTLFTAKACLLLDKHRGFVVC